MNNRVTLIPTATGFTIQDPITRRKIGEVKQAFLRDVKFRVWKSGQRRHTAGSAYQHAFIDGELVNQCRPGRGNTGVAVVYDPSKHDSFVTSTGAPGRPARVRKAVAAMVSPEGIFAYGVRE